MKKTEELPLPRFFYSHHNLVGKAYSALHCGRDCICRRSELAPEYLGIFNVNSRAFDRRVTETDRPSQKGRENVPSELSFASAPREADPMPVVTRQSEGTRPEPTSTMVTRSRAREGRGISIVPEAQIEPEIETRSEQEIETCEGGLGAARPFTADTGSLFTFAEIVTAHTSQEVTETIHFSALSQTPVSHTGSQPGVIFQLLCPRPLLMFLLRMFRYQSCLLITVMCQLLARLRLPVHRFVIRRHCRCMHRCGSRLLK